MRDDTGNVSSDRVDSRDAVHLVQFYESDAFLVGVMDRFIGPALESGEAAIVIATEPHLRHLGDQLAARDLQVATLARQGRYVALDAHATLAKIMVDGWPHGRRFAEVVGSLLTTCIDSHGQVRAFGEMVSILWANGQGDAAIRLEELWNDLGRTLPFTLLCAYSLADFADAHDDTPLFRICGQHSHVSPAESYTALESSDAASRVVTQLQQKARALDGETAARQEIERFLTLQQRRADRLQAWLAAIVDASRDAVIGQRPNGTVTSWNPSAERILGYGADEIIGTAMARIIAPECRAAMAAAVTTARGGARVNHFATTCVRKDKRSIDVVVTISPVRDHEGNVVGLSLIVYEPALRTFH